MIQAMNSDQFVVGQGNIPLERVMNFLRVRIPRAVNSCYVPQALSQRRQRRRMELCRPLPYAIG